MSPSHISIGRQLLGASLEFLAISFLTVLAFLLVYGLMRLSHRSERWILPIIGLLLLLLSLGRVLPGFIRQPGQLALNTAAIGSMMGLIAVVGALYALGQFVTRRAYLLTKKLQHSWRSANLRNILRFLRVIHQFLGWSVLIAAATHALLYIPWLLAPPLHARPLSSTALISGGIAWGILAILVGLGLWVENAIRQKRFTPRMRLIHTITAVVFFIVMIVHIGMK